MFIQTNAQYKCKCLWSLVMWQSDMLWTLQEEASQHSSHPHWSKQVYTMEVISKDQWWHIPSSLTGPQIEFLSVGGLTYLAVKRRDSSVFHRNWLESQSTAAQGYEMPPLPTWNDLCFQAKRKKRNEEEPWNVGRFQGIKCQYQLM